MSYKIILNNLKAKQTVDIYKAQHWLMRLSTLCIYLLSKHSMLLIKILYLHNENTLIHLFQNFIR